MPTPSDTSRVYGVYLSRFLDLPALYADHIAAQSDDVVMLRPEDVETPEDITVALCWKPEPLDFEPYPNLRVAMTIGAGVDALVEHKGIGPDVDIARVRDNEQAHLMAGFAVHEVLHKERHFHQMQINREQHTWQPMPMRAPGKVTIAILGYGTMGAAVARACAALGFDLRVATRTAVAEPISGITYLSGPSAIHDAARGADYLINVLPLTAQTHNILDAALFAAMAKGGYVIHIGRGEHLVEADLADALASGHLSGATLDVFAQEPLPPTHPFWKNDKIRITPHIASNSLPEEVARQLIETAHALRDGLPLPTAIDRERGY